MGFNSGFKGLMCKTKSHTHTKQEYIRDVSPQQRHLCQWLKAGAKGWTGHVARINRREIMWGSDGQLQEKSHFEDLGIDGRILKGP